MDTGSLIVITIFFLPLLLLIISHFRTKSLKKKYDASLKQSESLTQAVDELLSKYGSIIDIELHNQRITDEAEEEVLAKRNIAEQIVSEAMAEADTIVEEAKETRTEARQYLQTSKDKAASIESAARAEADKVISFAEAQAKEIAGNAYEAKAKADSYESAIRAMRNTIDGCKDDYIIPNHSVLDDLAEEFGHKEAGEELKAARKRVRDMVKDGYAGTCDYAEANRRMYAIHFAVDAFNGKVDSALAKVKHDNFGKIKQEIIDAFALVNHNGAPFRNARINQEFLDARLTELKWAVAANELKQIEKEEQAAIKAQMREEERAQRDMEKAIKEAEKEERILQKALEKARQELGLANEDQKAEYEAPTS